MKEFGDFVNYKNRLLLPKLEILASVFKQGKFETTESLEDINDPFIYIKSNKPVKFGGVRLYFLNDQLIYKPQKTIKDKPFGKAYPLDLNGFFEELMSEDVDEETMAKEIIDYLNQVITVFFQKNSELERKNKE